MRNPIQTIRFATTFVRLLRNPGRLDLVFKLADDTVVDPEVARELTQHPAIAPHLARRTPPPRVSLPALRALPGGSLGRTLADFLDGHGYDPTGLYHSGDVAPDASDLQWFKVHMERTHDIWHTVTGFDTDVAGELGLQAFGLAQLNVALGYVLLAAGMLSVVLFERHDGERRMEAIVRGWQLGRRTRPLFGVDWESMYTWPLEQVRAHLGLDAERPAAGLAA